jgi:hypothetical protein
MSDSESEEQPDPLADTDSDEEVEELWNLTQLTAKFGKGIDPAKPTPALDERSKSIWTECHDAELAAAAATPPEDLSHARMERLARFCENQPLHAFLNYFELVPTLVNVVTLCEALPHPRSHGGGKLPLDLHRIAARCSNSYYAPRRFAVRPVNSHLFDSLP